MSTDPLKRAFEDVRRTALPQVRRPGVDAARRTVRRRRNARIMAAVLALLACGLGAALNPWHGPSPTPPITTPSATPYASQSPQNSPSPEAVVGPSAPPCASDGRAIFVRRNGNTFTARFTPDGGTNEAGILPCAGFRVAVYVSSYYAATGMPSANNGGYLDSGHLTVSVTMYDDRCVDVIAAYYYAGTSPPFSLPAGSVNWGSPPQSDTLFLDTRHNRSAIIAGVHNSGCATQTPSPTQSPP